MQRKDLEGLSRDELVAKAEGLAVVRPRTLTMPELVDEILLATERKTGQTQKKSRGWFGRARDLLTSVIDRGFTEPDGGRTADRSQRTSAAAPAPLPTVTLAEIYAAQGHFERAITTLDEVVAKDPEHAEAKRLRERFSEQLRRTRPSAPPPPVELRPITIPPPAPGAAAPPQRAGDASSAESIPMSTTDSATTTETARIDPALAAAAPAGLGERYDVDEVVAVAVDPHTVYVYWEVRPSTLAEVRAKAPAGALTLRVISVTPGKHGDKPITEARDIRVDALFGEVFLRDVPANSNIRVTIAWKADELVPVAVGLDLATPREAPVAEVAKTFARFDGGAVADAYDALRAGGLARAGARQAPIGGPAFGRATREEIAFGHGTGDEADPPWLPTTDTVVSAGKVLRVDQRTFRGGASDTFRREIRFLGASDQARPGHQEEERRAVSLA